MLKLFAFDVQLFQVLKGTISKEHLDDALLSRWVREELEFADVGCVVVYIVPEPEPTRIRRSKTFRKTNVARSPIPTADLEPCQG
jgi:hypothetical protein